MTSFDWVGNHLALDFLNTVNWGEPEEPGERLVNYGALVDWAREADLLSESAARRLRRRETEVPRQGPRAVRRAHQLRSALHGLFATIARGGTPPREDEETFNRFLADVPLRVEPDPDGVYRWVWPASAATDRLDALLDPVIWAGAQLLTDDDLRARVKTCANDMCGWVFLDESRRGNRRWCDMRDCGNREKARRFYRRHRSAP